MIEVEKQKSDESDEFSRKILVCPKIGKKGPKWTQNGAFLSFPKIFSLLFAGSNIK